MVFKMEETNQIIEIDLKEDGFHIAFDRSGQLVRCSDSSRQVWILTFKDVYRISAEYYYWVDSQGKEVIDTLYSQKSCMFLAEKCLVTAKMYFPGYGRLLTGKEEGFVRIELDDIVRLVDEKGDIGTITTRTFDTQECKVESHVEHLRVGSSQQDYYEYMDPGSSFRIETKNGHVNIDYDTDEVKRLWNWIVDYFTARKKDERAD